MKKIPYQEMRKNRSLEDFARGVCAHCLSPDRKKHVEGCILNNENAVRTI